MIQIATIISNLLILGLSLLFIAVALFIIWVISSEIINSKGK